MQTEEFLVEVVCHQRSIYRVHATDAEAAGRIAAYRWQSSEPSDLPGLDWCELDAVHAMVAPDQLAEAQDDEVLLRFIRERERLLIRLGGTLLDASLNDAISASQAAADLGWYRPQPHGQRPVVDLARSSQALERLSSRKRLVYFERTRAREGERGEIRLYCTPDYLERLSGTIEEGVPQALG